MCAMKLTEAEQMLEMIKSDIFVLYYSDDMPLRIYIQCEAVLGTAAEEEDVADFLDDLKENADELGLDDEFLKSLKQALYDHRKAKQ